MTTKRLAAELGGLDMWNIWYHLRRLEERGLVHRPEGPKPGWPWRRDEILLPS